MLFFVFGRYRLAAAPAVWILAAGAVTDGLRRVGAARAGRPRAATAGGLLLAAAALVGLGQLPLRPDPGNLRTSWVNLSLVEMGEARVAPDAESAARHRDAAVDAARAAIAAAPSDADACWALVLALDLSTPVLPARREDGDLEAVRVLLVVEAERTGSADALHALQAPLEQQLALEHELRQRPSLAGRDVFVSASLVEALCRVAEFVRDGTDLPLALECLQEALRREPGDAVTLAQEGLVLKRMDRLAEAETAYRAALAAGADTVEVNNNLANVLLLLDRPAEAVPLLERALALEPGNDMVREHLERARRIAPQR
jgi:tetratricopeptide (TPR) repeat protein